MFPTEAGEMSERFPDQRRFAFTVFDDTDLATVENVGPVYRLLAEVGLRTTKSVWPLANVPGAKIAGATLQDAEYLKFILSLREQGFEIGLHNVCNSHATREVTEKGFAECLRLLGAIPRSHCNHHDNRDNVYWGVHRLSTLLPRLGYNLASRFRTGRYYQGHTQGAPYFWGDLCLQHISYVRNLVFDEINLDRINPTLPYHDLAKPFVNFWFSSSSGPTVESFCGTISEANQDRLEAEGGVCIMYTHFAAGFCRDGRVDAEFERLIRRLAAKPGWFVPVSTLLDHLRAGPGGGRDIPSAELTRMERRWFMAKLRSGTS
jgi:hypothetical protein